MPVTARIRYPLRAKVGVALAALAVLLELGAFGVFIAPLLPMVPVFFMVTLGNAFVLADVVQWAASLGRPEPVKVPRAEAAGSPRRTSRQEAAPAT